MSGWYIVRRLAFIGIGVALITSSDSPLFAVVLGWLCVVVNTFDLALQVVADALKERRS